MLSDYKIKALTKSNPFALTDYEISGNDRKKAIEVLNKFKQLEKQKKMANQENKCSGLKLEYQHSPDWDEIFETQEKLQNRIGVNVKGKTIKEIATYWMSNKHALEDELSEMFDALGGINDGIGNAAWKFWKSLHCDSEVLTIEDLSDKDLLELKFEIVDAFHFMINFAISIGMTGSEVYSLYKIKNKENFERQENNY